MMLSSRFPLCGEDMVVWTKGSDPLELARRAGIELPAED